MQDNLDSELALNYNFRNQMKHKLRVPGSNKISGRRPV